MAASSTFAAPPPLHFYKHSLSHLAPASPPTSLDSDVFSDLSTSPQPVSLLTLSRTTETQSSKDPSRQEHTGSPTPILRRDSLGSDAEVMLGLSSLAMHKEQSEPRKALKFAVAAPAHPHPPHRPTTPLDPETDSESDLGYEEDEEDGEFSDDEDYMTTIPKPSKDYPFARPTNYGDEPISDAPPAPAILSPPSRRGRGHIQVVDTHQAPKTCSRHCSPPPTRSRSGSEAARGRLSDAGPREGRCGSPMPDVSDLPDVEDDAGQDIEDFYGQSGQPRWRRASEHLPGFRQYGRRVSGEACPPTLDETPVFIDSLPRHEESVYHRLEANLANDTNLIRARSVGTHPSGPDRHSRPIDISRYP